MRHVGGRFWVNSRSILVNSGSYLRKPQETSGNLRNIPVFTRIYPYLPVLARIYHCVLTPLGSPTGSLKRSYVHVPVVPWPVAWWRCMLTCGAGVYQGGYTGWVWGGAIPGYYPAPARKGPRTAERAPEGLQGLEWVVLGAWTRHPYVQAPGPPLRGPVGSLWDPPCPGPFLEQNPPPGQ